MNDKSKMKSKIIPYYALSLMLIIYILTVVYMTIDNSEQTNNIRLSRYFDDPEHFMYSDDYMYQINALFSYQQEYDYYEESPFIHFEGENMSEPVFDPDILNLNPEEIVKRIAPVPEHSRSDATLPLPQKVYDHFLILNKTEYNDDILILTPIQNAENFLSTYASLLTSLSYPRHLISIVFGEDGSKDNTVDAAREIVIQLRNEGFKYVNLHEFYFADELNVDPTERHMEDLQYLRRRHIAKARNGLVQKFLTNQSWVLWIDSDVNSIPKDLIQQLLFANSDVVVPCCLYKGLRYKHVYDKNTWRETEKSLESQKYLMEDALVVEGYAPTLRLYLPHLRAEGRIVPIDGVGGCVLLVRAACHVQGLNFPEEIYKHHIETEGLAKMAVDMGFKVYGLPFLEVFH